MLMIISELGAEQSLSRTRVPWGQATATKVADGLIILAQNYAAVTVVCPLCFDRQLAGIGKPIDF